MPREKRFSGTFSHFSVLGVPILFLLGAWCVAGCRAPQSYPLTGAVPGAPDHVVIIVIDALRADHLPIYGYERDTAPFLTSLAEGSLVFTDAASVSSYTPESISALFTGLYPSATPWGAGWHARPSLNHTTLAMHFRDAGYQTALFSATPMLDHPEFHRGFDTAVCDTEFGLSGQSGRLVETALAWLGERRTQKTLIYLHLLDPHAPYDPPTDAYERFGGARPGDPVTMDGELRSGLPALIEEGFGPGEVRFEDLVQRYDAEIFDVDRAIRAYFDGLADLGLERRSLAVVTADHGEEFLDHGFVEHAWSLYPETYRVPLLLWGPGHIAPGRQSGAISLVDVFPTLIALQELPGAPDNLSGNTLLEPLDGLWRARTPAGPRILEQLIQSRMLIRGVVTESSLYLAYWKYLSPAECAETAGNLRAIRRELRDGTRAEVDPWGPIVREEYYDLTRDPDCRNNLAAERPGEVTRWRLYLREYQETCPPQLPDAYKATRDPSRLTPKHSRLLDAVDPVWRGLLEPVPIDEELLETLGYL